MLLVVSLLFALGTTLPVVADEGHHHDAANHCDSPTMQLNVTAGQDNTLSYNLDTYTVPIDTCIMLTLINVATDNVVHDLQIDAVEGDDGIDLVHLHAEAGHQKSMHILTPDADTEFTIYCTVEGHRDQGMEAVLVVGDGASTLSVDIRSVFFGVTFFAALISIRRFG